jgi:cytidylate kinase
MKDQIIITIGRESGSGGHAIAKKVADAMGIPCYDKKKLVEGTAQISGMNKNYVRKLDEKPVGFPFSGRIGAFEESPESNVARMTFEYIRQIAASGESCVIVGRCADSVLKDNPNALRIFIVGDVEEKNKRLSNIQQITLEEADQERKETDRFRRAYHNFYSETKWGDSRAYDLIINSSRLGIQGTADYIKVFADAFKEA